MSHADAWAMENDEGVRFLGIRIPYGDYTISLDEGRALQRALHFALDQATFAVELPKPEPVEPLFEISEPHARTRSDPNSLEDIA